MTITPQDRARRFSGRWIVILLGLSLLLVPLFAWLGVKWSQSRRGYEQPLNWQTHTTWPAPPVRPTDLAQSPIRGFFEGGSWRDLAFDVSAEEEAVVRKLVDIAWTMAEAPVMDEALRERIVAASESMPDHFYAQLLLAVWHQQRGENQQAEQYFQQAFANADAVLRIPVRDAANRMMPHLQLGTAAIECPRVQNDKLDHELVLVYPRLMTDEIGHVYLPIYHTVYHLVQWPAAPGYVATYPNVSQWFEFPGRFGTLKPIMVSPVSD